jgi:hypothetical protein
MEFYRVETIRIHHSGDLDDAIHELRKRHDIMSVVRIGPETPNIETVEIERKLELLPDTLKAPQGS